MPMASWSPERLTVTDTMVLSKSPDVQASAAHTLHYRQSEDIAKMTGSRIAIARELLARLQLCSSEQLKFI